MSVELKDYRGRITAETDCVLEARSRATGRDRQEIVREILHAWALEEIHASSVLDHLLRAEGLGGTGGGIAGNLRESEGARGNGRESGGGR